VQSHIQGHTGAYRAYRGLQYKFKYQITLTTTASTDHVLDENGMLERKAKNKQNKEGHVMSSVPVCRHSRMLTVTWDGTQHDMQHKED